MYKYFFHGILLKSNSMCLKEIQLKSNRITMYICGFLE